MCETTQAVSYAVEQMERQLNAINTYFTDNPIESAVRHLNELLQMAVQTEAFCNLQPNERCDMLNDTNLLIDLLRKINPDAEGIARN